MTELEKVLGFSFSDASLLRLALTHRSISADHADRGDNERLEFLGDAVLQLIVTNKIYSGYPQLPEGQLAKVRAAAVSGRTLAEIAARIGIGAHIELSPAERRSGGAEKASILANTLEAIIGAVYLDAGFDAATDLVHHLWGETIDEKARNPGVRDYKTRLQEVLAATGRRPSYLVSGAGPDHQRVFSAVVSVEGKVLGRGEGRSKKDAEQESARIALNNLS